MGGQQETSRNGSRAMSLLHKHLFIKWNKMHRDTQVQKHIHALELHRLFFFFFLLELLGFQMLSLLLATWEKNQANKCLVHAMRGKNYLRLH